MYTLTLYMEAKLYIYLRKTSFSMCYTSLLNFKTKFLLLP